VTAINAASRTLLVQLFEAGGKPKEIPLDDCIVKG